MKTILVSAYLRGDEHLTKRRYIEALDARLRTLGYRLHLVNLVPGRKLQSPCDSVSVPSIAIGPHRAPGARAFRNAVCPGELQLAAGIEAEMRGWHANEAALKLVYYRAFMRELLRKYTPALCVLWHQFNPHHLALADLCRDCEIPVAFAEYGLLPGTIAFDTDGQMAESWIAANSDRFLELPVEAQERTSVEKYLNHVRQEKKTRKPQTPSPDISAIVARLREQDRKIIFYAGEHGYHSGMLPHTLPRAKIHSPFYKSTCDALEEVGRIAQRNNWHVLFKPHPLAEDAMALTPELAKNITSIPGANIFDCIECSDVTTTILSQTSYLSLIHGRAVVLLGRNPLSGKGCIYEINDRSDLEIRLHAAIQNGLTAEQKTAWHRHAAQLCRHYLFAIDDDTCNRIGRGPEAAARLLVELAEASNPEKTKLMLAANPRLFANDVGPNVSPMKLRLAYNILRRAEPLLRATLAISGKARNAESRS